MSAFRSKAAFIAVVDGFKSSAVWVALEIGLFTSEVLSTLSSAAAVFKSPSVAQLGVAGLIPRLAKTLPLGARERAAMPVAVAVASTVKLTGLSNKLIGI